MCYFLLAIRRYFFSFKSSENIHYFISYDMLKSDLLLCHADYAIKQDNFAGEMVLFSFPRSCIDRLPVIDREFGGNGSKSEFMFRKLPSA